MRKKSNFNNDIVKIATAQFFFSMTKNRREKNLYCANTISKIEEKKEEKKNLDCDNTSDKYR